MLKQKSVILKYTILSIFCLSSYIIYGQEKESYGKAYTELSLMLENKIPTHLHQAIFCVENAWYDGKLNHKKFNDLINGYANLCRMVSHSDIIHYSGEDEKSVKSQAAVFAFITDSIPILVGDSLIWHPPFQYNYKDFAGKKDWSNMFVSTLLATGKGNCHSMPLLYKLIMNQLGEKCWLALAPNHMYIKAKTRQSGWYNIELTTGHHPTDAWIITSGFIHLDAIRNRIYMDTLTVKEEIALCLVDLAQGYDRKYPENDGIFIEKCCRTALTYYPACINARLIQAEIMTRKYLKINDKESLVAQKLKDEMERAYTEIHRLGYRKMPEKMYREWLSNSSAYNEKAPNHRAINYQ